MDTKELDTKMEQVAWHLRRWKDTDLPPLDEGDRDVFAAGLALARELAEEVAPLLDTMVRVGLIRVVVFDKPGRRPFSLTPEIGPNDHSETGFAALVQTLVVRLYGGR